MVQVNQAGGNVKVKERPSVYLAEKCNALERAVDFFLCKKTGHLKSLEEKRAVFLSQIDFWDWEIESLRYSFDSFAERSQCWESAQEMGYALADKGLPVRKSVLNRVSHDRSLRSCQRGMRPILRRGKVRFVTDESSRGVEPPAELMARLLRKWDDLLTVCEKTLFQKPEQVERTRSWGIDVAGDLSKYRKRSDDA